MRIHPKSTIIKTEGEKVPANAPAQNHYKNVIEEKHFTQTLSETITKWVMVKAENKHPYTRTTLEGLLSEIEKEVKKHGEQAVIETIKYSIHNNYSGIYFDRIGKNQQKKTSGKTKFSNFHEREYDFQDLEKKLLEIDRKT